MRADRKLSTLARHVREVDADQNRQDRGDGGQTVEAREQAGPANQYALPACSRCPNAVRDWTAAGIGMLSEIVLCIGRQGSRAPVSATRIPPSRAAAGLMAVLRHPTHYADMSILVELTLRLCLPLK